MKERVTYDEFAMSVFYRMLRLIVFSSLKVRKFSNNYVLAHCVSWNKRKGERLPITHMHMTIFFFLQILASLIATLTNPSLLLILFVKIIEIKENQLCTDTLEYKDINTLESSYLNQSSKAAKAKICHLRLMITACATGKWAEYTFTAACIDFLWGLEP